MQAMQVNPPPPLRTGLLACFCKYSINVIFLRLLHKHELYSVKFVIFHVTLPAYLNTFLSSEVNMSNDGFMIIRL